MGSLPKFTKGLGDRVSLCENAEIQLKEAKQRCEIEIQLRSIKLKMELEDTEKRLKENLDETCKKLLQELHGLSLSKSNEYDEERLIDVLEKSKIKFTVANYESLHLSSHFGFISHNDLLPTDLSLDLVNKLVDIRTGVAIKLTVSANKPIFKPKDGRILVNVELDGEVLKEDEVLRRTFSADEMRIKFTAAHPGAYHVSVKLFDQNIDHSPLIIPIVDDPEEMFNRCGIKFASSESAKNSIKNEVQNDSFTSIKADSNATDTVKEYPDNSDDLGRESSIDTDLKGHRWEIGEKCFLSNYDLDSKLVQCEVISMTKNVHGLFSYIVKMKDNDDQITVRESDLLPLSVVDDSLSYLNSIIDEDKNHTGQAGASANVPEVTPSSLLGYNFTVGQKVQALKEETQLWENGEIHKALPDGSFYVVRYDDGSHGGFTAIQAKSNIQPCFKWYIGDVAIARWSQDNVWYNVKIIECLPLDNFKVLFVNYGNEDIVSVRDIVSSTKEITDNSYIDEHVYQEEVQFEDDSVPFVSRKDVVPDDTDYDDEMERLEEEIAASKISVANHVNQGDSKLRRPKVLGDGDSVALDEEIEKKIQNLCQSSLKELQLPSLSPVPPSLQCCICKKILKKAMKLSCDNSQVCWGCGVKEITKNHTCWSCQSRISSSHLFKDDQLREAVEDFVKTGSISNTKLPNVEEVQETEEDERQVCLVNYDVFDLTKFISYEGGKNILKADKECSVVVADPTGLTKLEDGSILVCSTSTNSVIRWSQQSTTQIKIGPSREFLNPTDVLACNSGEVVIADSRGLHLFDSSLVYVKSLNHNEKCCGVAEDDEGRLLTINHEGEGKAKVLFIDKETDKLVKQIDMEGIIKAAIEHLKDELSDLICDNLVSQCISVKVKKGIIYVVDLGLDCVFVLESKEASMVGKRGKGPVEFRDPMDVFVDDIGNMIVVDSRNHRLQIISPHQECIGVVKPDPPIARPSRIFVDSQSRELYVSNKLSKVVVKYKIMPK